MLARLAFRNLWRNTRRTLLTLSAMVVSAALLILALGVFSGMFEDMLASATEQYSGHIVLAQSDYHQRRDLYAHLPLQLVDAEALRATPEVTGRSGRLRGFGLLSSGETSQPVELLGIRADQERRVTRLHRFVSSGTFLDAADEDGIVLGRGLATRLGVAPGDELVFVTQAADGSIGNDLLTVRGIFATGDSRQDNGLALVPLPWLQRLLALDGRIHEVAVRVAEPLRADLLATRLNSQLPDDVTALGWGALLPEMREVIASYDVSRMIFVAILYVATGLGILNTFFMSVMERHREFGILLAQGMRPWAIRRMVLLETLLLGSLALVIGVTLGGLLTLYMQRVGIDLSSQITPITYAGGTILPRLRAVFVLDNFLVPAVTLLLVSLLAGFLPANRAAGLDPVTALREE
ncbi:MAG: FtsX-like permease family protein [Desulfuromonadales bacterium]|nr:FtsX-like permease family protein [Desulfuromonadales bacterium]